MATIILAKMTNTSSNFDFRYERKFLITGLTVHEVEHVVKYNPAMFREIYHQRFVNNIYMDYFNLKNFFENVEGSQKRLKARIRWYGDLLGHVEKPVLELKIKDALLGRKESFELGSFLLDKEFNLGNILDLFKKAKIPNKTRGDLLAMEFSLVNRYSRKYYMSADQDYRVTIDSGMEFYNISQRANNFLHKSSDFSSIVLELKYNHDKDGRADRIASKFPFIMTKNSKYVSGLERLDLW